MSTAVIQEAAERFKTAIREEVASIQKTYDGVKGKFIEALEKDSLSYAIEWHAENAAYCERALELITPLAAFIEGEESLAIMVDRVRQWRDQAVRQVLTRNPEITSSGWGHRLVGWGAWQADREFAELLAGEGFGRIGYTFSELDKLTAEELAQ